MFFHRSHITSYYSYFHCGCAHKHFSLFFFFIIMLSKNFNRYNFYSNFFCEFFFSFVFPPDDLSLINTALNASDNLSFLLNMLTFESTNNNSILNHFWQNISFVSFEIMENRLRWWIKENRYFTLILIFTLNWTHEHSNTHQHIYRKWFA